MDRKKWTFDGRTRMCRSVFRCMYEDNFNNFPTLKDCKDTVRNYMSAHDCCNHVDPGNPHDFDKTEGWCVPKIANRATDEKLGNYGFWWKWLLPV